MKYLLSNRIFFLILLVIQSILCIRIWLHTYNIEMTTYSLGEALINYEAGFVRRGFLGEIFYLTGQPKLYAMLAQKVVLSLFLILSLISLFIWKNKIQATSYFLLMTLSPGGLVDLSGVDGFEFMDRKEIWFYFTILVVAILNRWTSIKPILRTALSALLFSVMILTHEAFFLFFGPIILCAYASISAQDRTKDSRGELFIIFTPMFISFSLALAFHGNPEMADAIRNSYIGTDAALFTDKAIAGGIGAIGWSFETSHASTLELIKNGSLLFWFYQYILSLGFSGLLTILLYRSGPYGAMLAASFGWMASAVLILAYIGWDWGRWISIGNLGFGSVAIYLQSLEERIDAKLDVTVDHTFKGASVFMVILLMLVLSTTAGLTQLPICCQQSATIPLSLRELGGTLDWGFTPGKGY